MYLKFGHKSITLSKNFTLIFSYKGQSTTKWNICIRWETDQKCSPKTLIGSVIVSVLASSAVDRGFESRSSQTKDYKIDMCCFSAEHAALRRKGKDWLARNQDNFSVLGDMSIRELFQWVNGQAKEEKGTTTKHYTYILFRDILSNQYLQNKWTSTLRIESDKFFLLIDRCGLPLLISVSLIQCIVL